MKKSCYKTAPTAVATEIGGKEVKRIKMNYYVDLLPSNIHGLIFFKK
jgi:hypothetical protein